MCGSAKTLHVCLTSLHVLFIYQLIESIMLKSLAAQTPVSETRTQALQPVASRYLIGIALKCCRGRLESYSPHS